jgi:prepilin-type N-terminal cleavage/methylation domain-containing protein
MQARSQRAFSLVEMLVVIVIIAVLAAVLMPRYLGKSGTGKSAATPMQRAHSVECINNLRQIRQAYTMTTASEDERPATLADLCQRYKIPESMSRCPVGKEPYRFDPATGVVKCVHPGHEDL